MQRFEFRQRIDLTSFLLLRLAGEHTEQRNNEVDAKERLRILMRLAAARRADRLGIHGSLWNRINEQINLSRFRYNVRGWRLLPGRIKRTEHCVRVIRNLLGR